MKFAILVFPGSGSDVDMHRAVSDVLGEEAELVWHTDAAQLKDYDAVVVPNGTSYGNYLRPGALAKGSNAMTYLCEFAASGKPVLGVGNGFHILAEANLVPGAFLQNKGLKFQTGATTLTVENASSQFTNAYTKGEEITLPFAHQYGNYFVDEATLQEMKANNQIVFTYQDDQDHGSVEKIAGVINKEGNVLGVMPLPERAVEEILGHVDGYRLFKSILKKVE